MTSDHDSGAGQITVDVRLDQSAWSTHLAEQTLIGLRDDPPWIPPVWFYDEVGSSLFEEITRLEEYYPTATERGIITAHAADVAELTGAETLAELGSGTSDKTRLLLDALTAHGSLRRFAPFDCSEEVLRTSSASIAGARPDLGVHAVVGDFHEHLSALPTEGVCLLAFLGSTIGNLDPPQRKGFLGEVASNLDSDDWFLLGADLVKPVERLLAAYDDPGGVTARFNLNSLSVMNTELLADFDPGGFRHRAHWNEADSRIEMHLVSTRDQRVEVHALEGLTVDLAEGSHIRTEISTKFAPGQVDSELADAGFEVVASWFDDRGDFQLTLARPI